MTAARRPRYVVEFDASYGISIIYLDDPDLQAYQRDLRQAAPALASMTFPIRAGVSNRVSRSPVPDWDTSLGTHSGGSLGSNPQGAKRAGPSSIQSPPL